MIFPESDAQKVFFHSDRLTTWLRDGQSYPITFEVDPTNACNHACSFCCWSYLQEHDRATMSWPLLQKILDNLVRIGTRGIVWTGGGEPLVNRHTPAAMEYARARGLRNGLFTNGALISEDNVDTLLRSCDWIRVSIAAGTRAEYQRIQGVDDLDRVRERVSLLVRRRRELGVDVKLGAMMLLHKSSIATFLDFVAMCRELELDYANGKPHNNYDHETRSMWIQERNVRLRKNAGDHGAQIDPQVTEYDPLWWERDAVPLLLRARELETATFRVGTSQYVSEKYGAPSLVSDEHACHVNNFVTAITASGDVAWCKNLRDRAEYVIGNIRNQTIEEIWASPRRKAVQAAIDARLCERFCQNKKLNRILEQTKHAGAAQPLERPTLTPLSNPEFL